jgi:GTPase SAR1 family protein
MLRLSRNLEAKLNAKTSKQLAKEAAEAKLTVKLLILGAGGSGKTTLRKQLQVLYGNAFATAEERQEVADIIIGNLLDGIRSVVAASFDPAVGEGITSELSLGAAQIINSLEHDAHRLSPNVSDALKVLWKDYTFQKAVVQRSKFQLQECFLHFFEEAQNYPAWGGPAWIPSVEDCVRARVRTSGVIQINLKIDDLKFSIIDCGGQRAERRKWIDHFDDITALIFVAALSDYDEFLYEDSAQNRLNESLHLFESLQRDHDWDTLLFLNKMDIFHQKFSVAKIPINASGCFPHAPKGTDDEMVAVDYIANLYQSRVCKRNKGAFYVHAMTAVNLMSVGQLFEDVKCIVLSKSVASLMF